jgi:hypothetical protein
MQGCRSRNNSASASSSTRVLQRSDINLSLVVMLRVLLDPVAVGMIPKLRLEPISSEEYDLKAMLNHSGFWA